jgi:DNA-binding IclR family transcriptional regulator
MAPAMKPQGSAGLTKLLAVLEASLAELERRTGVPKGTLHGIVAGLVQQRLLERDGVRYRLGGRLFEVAMRASLARGLIEQATPFLEDLYEQTHETVHLGVRQGLDVLYVLKLGGHVQADEPSRIGGRMPLHCTAIGKVLLAGAPNHVLGERVAAGLIRLTPRTVATPGGLCAQLDDVRTTGLAYEYEESAAGIV